MRVPVGKQGTVPFGTVVLTITSSLSSPSVSTVVTVNETTVPGASPEIVLEAEAPDVAA
jgi:hypothetical protein